MSRSHIPTWMKRQVVDWFGTACLACGVETTTGADSATRREFDHVIPEDQGGLTCPRNLQILCRTCNRRKHRTHIDHRPPGWYQPPVHLVPEEGGCPYVDAGTWTPGHWVGETYHPESGRKQVTTRDPFAVTCASCWDQPRMQVVALQIRAEVRRLAAA